MTAGENPSSPPIVRPRRRLARQHTALWIDFAGKIGPLLFAATLVAYLLSGTDLRHIVLIAAGVLMMALDYWYSYHRKERSGP